VLATRRVRWRLGPASVCVGLVAALALIGSATAQAANQILRPNADVNMQWNVVGDTEGWAVLDDPIEQPTGPGGGDNIEASGANEHARVAHDDVTLPPGSTPTDGRVWFYAFTNANTRLEINVYWNGALRATRKIAKGQPFAWRSLAALPPDEVAINDLDVRFTTLDNGVARVRASYFWLQAYGGPPLRFADNEVASGEWDALNASGTGTVNTRVNSQAYTGSWSLRHDVGPSVGSGDAIARANWFAPGGAIAETDPLAADGQEIWFGSAFRFQSGDDHLWTSFLRLSDNFSGDPHCVIQAVYGAPGTFLDGTFFVSLEDYGNAGPTGVSDVTYFSNVPMPLDEWIFIELGVFVHHDTSTGWIELWVNGSQVGSRVLNRTLKLEGQQYRRVQIGLGNYLTEAGNSASVWTDRSYLADARLGP